MLKFAIPAAAALALIAVAAQSRATDSDVQFTSAEMGWHLSHEPGLAKLAYGVQNSDQLALMMTCEQGSTQATVYGDVQPAGVRFVRASMTSEIDPLSGDLSEEALISVRDPAMRTLRDDGHMAVESETGRFELRASRDERRQIADFFAYCGSDRI